MVSYARLDQESSHEARQELTGYMQQLGEQPRLAAEIQLQYGVAQSNELLSFVNAETELLANQARTVMRRIPDQVTTLEYVTVGYAFQSSGHLPDAQELYGRGRDVARNPLDRVVSLRSLGNVRYLVGDTAGGRAFFAQARAVYAKEAMRRRSSCLRLMRKPSCVGPAPRSSSESVRRQRDTWLSRRLRRPT
ncbi:MAG: hypothetical protein ABIP53_08845 [Candidatus Limnocylindrales bacterium]